ncbi:ankyrin repeat-containing domain protein [Mycena epipterygia]|nr:ankyrin repeat-containing domain protein [Mycena epipterygia]
MLRDYFEQLPPELISLLPPSLSTSVLNALVLTCCRLREILQPELEARITPELGKELLLWAAASKPHIVAKLLSPPHLIHPSEGYGQDAKTPLHVAAESKNPEIVALLLDAGADLHLMWDQDEYKPLHLAAMQNDLQTMKLLLDRGASIDDIAGADGLFNNALHCACAGGHLETVEFLLERGADMECRGHYGTALGFAVHCRNMDLIKLLLKKGAKAEASTPLNAGWLCGGPPPPRTANLLYFAMGLRHPRSQYSPQPPPEDGRKELMALLLVHGANVDVTMETIFKYLTPLADAAEKTEEEFLVSVKNIFKEAESVMPRVTTTRRMWEYKVKAGMKKGRRSLVGVSRSAFRKSSGSA